MTFGDKVDAIRRDLRKLAKEFNENEAEQAALKVQEALASLRAVEGKGPDSWWDWDWK